MDQATLEILVDRLSDTLCRALGLLVVISPECGGDEAAAVNRIATNLLNAIDDVKQIGRPF